MQRFHIRDMTGGWFVGDFSPTVLCSKDFEVALKLYPEKCVERRHTHRRAVEITVIVEGRARMNHLDLCPGDIVEVAPGESVEFEVLCAPLTTVVVKSPSVRGDKFFD